MSGSPRPPRIWKRTSSISELDKDEQFYRDTESIAFPNLDDRLVREPGGAIIAHGSKSKASRFAICLSQQNCRIHSTSDLLS
jgi:murein L,D-transpeptidase YafK